jgi:hypothetical protein
MPSGAEEDGLMGLLAKQISQHVPEIAVGIGAGLVTQMLVMAVIAMARPVAKTAIKGGFIIRDVASGAYSLAESQVGKLAGKSEAKSLRRLPKPRTGSSSLT